LPTAQDHLRPAPGALLAHLHHLRPWHRGSLFGEGPRRPLSADQRRAWLARAHLERRAGRLTALYVEVGRALLKRLGENGQCDPSHATVAADAGCGERTVRRALVALRALGLLTWEQRLVRRPWPEGGPGASRAEQTSNAYALLLPTAVVAASAPRASRCRPDCGGQAGRETSPKMIPRELPPFDPAAKKALQEIAAIRAVRFQREWGTKRAERWDRRGHGGPS
jgi:hypothetical protein